MIGHITTINNDFSIIQHRTMGTFLQNGITVESINYFSYKYLFSL